MGTLKSIIFTFLLGVSFAAAQDYEVIPWTASTKLTWEDFKGEPTNDRAAAITASGVTYRFSSERIRNKVSVDFEITAHFYPHKSWHKPDLSDANILAHEQLHFDISELFAREMRRRMKATKFTRNVRNEVKKIYNQINKEMNDFQNTYDAETNFSRDREQQESWELKVDEVLRSN